MLLLPAGSGKISRLSLSAVCQQEEASDRLCEALNWMRCRSPLHCWSLVPIASFSIVNCLHASRHLTP